MLRHFYPQSLHQFGWHDSFGWSFLYFRFFLPSSSTFRSQPLAFKRLASSMVSFLKFETHEEEKRPTGHRLSLPSPSLLPSLAAFVALVAPPLHAHNCPASIAGLSCVYCRHVPACLLVDSRVNKRRGQWLARSLSPSLASGVVMFVRSLVLTKGRERRRGRWGFVHLASSEQTPLVQE